MVRDVELCILIKPFSTGAGREPGEWKGGNVNSRLFDERTAFCHAAQESAFCDART